MLLDNLSLPYFIINASLINSIKPRRALINDGTCVSGVFLCATKNTFLGGFRPKFSRDKVAHTQNTHIPQPVELSSFLDTLFSIY